MCQPIKPTIRRSLLAALAVGAAAWPSAASAKFELNDPVPAPVASGQSAATSVQQAKAEQPSSSQFDWTDAGIGAAGTLALMGSGTLAVVGRRRRSQTARTS
jgi:hypothetical protein